MQWCPNSVAWRTPDHLAAGCGGFQRRSPTGGAAYGMPRNALTLPSVLPSTAPVRILTMGPDEANEMQEVAMNRQIAMLRRPRFDTGISRLDSRFNAVIEP